MLAVYRPIFIIYLLIVVIIKPLSCIIILMLRNNTEESRNESALIDTIDASPQREEWAIINKYKALQFERMKARERMLDRQKKESFRRQLDNQLSNRTNAQQKQKDQDRLYYQQLSQKAQTLKQKDQMQKYERFARRRMIEDENMQKLQAARSSRVNDHDTGYHLQIGFQSEREHKEKSQYFKKEMLDTLDLQLKEKTQEAKKNRLHNQQVEEMHKQMQENYFKPAEKRQYFQNQKIYEYYNQIEHERQIREKELEQKMVDEVLERSLRAQAERAKLEESKKALEKGKVKEMLDQQVRELAKKRTIQSKANPEDASYEFISNMFRPKEQAFNKETYKRQLERQAEEQRQRRLKENHMSEQEYKININQLSKAVVGSYSQNNYLDRSLGAIGDHKKFELDSLQYDPSDKDAEIVKKRLETLKNRGTIISNDSRQF